MKFPKSLALALVVMMTFSMLAACASTAPSPAPGSAPPAGTTAPSDGATVAPTAPAEPTHIAMFVNMAWWTAKTFTGHVPEAITKATNVILDVQVAADDKQLPLMIASGDLPELIYTADNLTRLADDKLCFDWGSLVQQYAPDWKIPAEQSALYLRPNGKFYTMLNNFSTEAEWKANPKALQNVGGIVVNKALYESIGSPAVNTLEDFTNMLVDAKGKLTEGVTPLRVGTVSGWQTTFFKEQFGINAADNLWPWAVKDGKVINAIKQDNYLPFYEFVNSLYLKGLVNPEDFASSTTGIGDAENAMKAGKALAYTANAQAADKYNTDATAKAAGQQFIMLRHNLTDTVKQYCVAIGWAGVFITKNNQHPDLSIKFMQFMFSPEGQHLGEWGVEDTDWQWADDAKSYPKFLYNTLDSDLMVQEGYFWWGLLGGSAVTEGLRNYNPDTLATPVMEEAMPNEVYDPIIGMLLPDADTEEATILTKVSDMIKTEQVKCFLADSKEACAANYQAMLQKAQTLGLDKLETWANNRYNEIKANMGK